MELGEKGAIYQHVVNENFFEITNKYSNICLFLGRLPTARDTCQTYGYVLSALTDILDTLNTYHKTQR